MTSPDREPSSQNLESETGRMRILHTVAPSPFGGLEEVVIRLTSGLAARGHEVTVAATFSGVETDHPFVRSIRSAGVNVVPIFVSNRAYWQEMVRVREVVEQVGAEVVHTHGYRADVLHGRAVRPFRPATVTTLHGFTGGDPKNRLYQWLQVRSARSRDAVVAVSRAMTDRLRRQGVPEEILHVIPNAWEARSSSEPPNSARSTLRVPDGAFHVGWVGRMTPEKGPDVFLDALNVLPGPGVHASMVGDGRLRSQVEERALELGGSEVTFHGALPEAGRLYSAFDVFVISSRSEGTPMVLFEAMEAGVPLVVTAVGGIPDVVDETTALLVPPEDPSALAEAIRSVRDDPEGAKARAERARLRLERDFAPDPWAARHEELYGGLVRDRPLQARHS